MKIKVTTKGITLDVDMSVAELIELAKEFDKEETVADASVAEDNYGYGVKQYKMTDLGNYSIEEVYMGFIIYKSKNYYRWCPDEDFDNRSNLNDDLDSVKMEIKHHVKSKLAS